MASATVNTTATAARPISISIQRARITASSSNASTASTVASISTHASSASRKQAPIISTIARATYGTGIGHRHIGECDIRCIDKKSRARTHPAATASTASREHILDRHICKRHIARYDKKAAVRICAIDHDGRTAAIGSIDVDRVSIL